MSSNRIPLAAVIGAPIAHSRSPRLFRHWLRKYGMPGHYIPMEVPADKLEETLRLLPALGFVGLNVTIPYKERVMEIADLVSDRATLIGAANTLIFRKDGRIHADNTDGYGFIEGCTTVVNTTSLGMVGKPELRVPLDAIGPGMLVTDLVYTPLDTRLIQAGREQGAQVVDGLGMLLHQAVPGFERWFGHRPEIDQGTRDAVLV